MGVVSAMWTTTMHNLKTNGPFFGTPISGSGRTRFYDLCAICMGYELSSELGGMRVCSGKDF